MGNRGLHNLFRSMVKGARLAQQIAIGAAALFGPGRAHPAEKWWFDVECVDDLVQSWD